MTLGLLFDVTATESKKYSIYVQRHHSTVRAITVSPVIMAVSGCVLFGLAITLAEKYDTKIYVIDDLSFVIKERIGLKKKIALY